MSVKFFFERLWENEQRNELFVCMPFDKNLDNKFNQLIQPAAKKAGFDKAERVKENIIADLITTKIFDGIANSKMLLFDLSDDPSSPCKPKQVNGNVLYELGIANSFRDPQDIILIREESSHELPFDVRGIRYIEYKKPGNVKELTDGLKEALENQKWHKSKRIKVVAQSIDGEALKIMFEHGRLPEGFNHFHTNPKSPEIKMSVLRMLDLGIIRFAWEVDGEYSEHAFRWTPFGHEVMKYMDILPLTEDEFKKKPDYQDHLHATKEFVKYKEERLKSLKKS